MEKSFVTTVHNRIADLADSMQGAAVHGDRAKKYGFERGLVGGAVLIGHLVNVAVDRWGDEWIDQGDISARFRHPVYDGDEITVSSSGIRQGLGLAIANSSGKLCIDAEAFETWRGRQPSVLPLVERDTALKLGSPDVIQADIDRGVPLPPMQADIELSLTALGDVGQNHPIFQDYINPTAYIGAALRPFMNAYEWRSVLIHTGFRMRLFQRAALGSTLHVRGFIRRIWTAKGHRYAGSEVQILTGDGQLVAHFDIDEIYQMRQDT